MRGAGCKGDLKGELKYRKRKDRPTTGGLSFWDAEKEKRVMKKKRSFFTGLQ